MVALLHGDAHDTATRQRFRHVAACHVKANTDAASSTWLATWKKRGGRVVDSVIHSLDLDSRVEVM